MKDSYAESASVETMEVYEAIKGSLKNPKEALFNGNYAKAELYLSKAFFPMIWESLLHYSMLRKNCHVSKLVTVHLIRSKILSKDQLALKVSMVDNKVGIEFSQRLNEYLKSEDFDIEIEKLEKVRRLVHKQVKSQVGVGYINPNMFAV